MRRGSMARFLFPFLSLLLSFASTQAASFTRFMCNESIAPDLRLQGPIMGPIPTTMLVALRVKLQTLSGGHLTLTELEWSPFGIYDATKSVNDRWTGFDIDVLNEVSTTLGFTYTLASVENQDGESWMTTALRGASESDMLLSYWLQTPEGRAKMIQLVSHIDADLVLVTKIHKAKSPEFQDRMV